MSELKLYGEARKVPTARIANLRSQSSERAKAQATPAKATIAKTACTAMRSNGSTSNSRRAMRSDEHTSELQSLMRISYAVFCLNKKDSTVTHTIKNIFAIKNRNSELL